MRPYATGEKRPRYAVYVESILRGSMNYKIGATEEQIVAYLTEQRKGDNWPLCVSALATENGVLFTVVCEANRQKLEWDVTRGHTAGELKAKTEEFATKGYRPSCVTAYPFDGAARYCVVWVKDPPKKP
jgi:hypothetical protein